MYHVTVKRDDGFTVIINKKPVVVKRVTPSKRQISRIWQQLYDALDPFTAVYTIKTLYSADLAASYGMNSNNRKILLIASTINQNVIAALEQISDVDIDSDSYETVMRIVVDTFNDTLSDLLADMNEEINIELRKKVLVKWVKNG